MPATSPTLSPTLSAMTAGFLGSSSGMPASTLPTRSAPTSAALVKIPPPTRAKRAIELAPRPNPVTWVRTSAWVYPVKVLIATYAIESPRSPSPTTAMPMTEPLENETRNASAIPRRAAFVVRTFAAVAVNMPM